MAKTKAVFRFMADDGTEFDSQRGAENHNQIADTVGEIKRLQTKLRRLMVAGKHTTADGEPFEFSEYQDYYLLEKRFGTAGVRRFQVTYLTEVLIRDGELEITENCLNNTKERISLADLYKSEKAANVACLTYLELIRREENKVIDRIKEKIAGMPG